jgi:hypothetical protein
MKKIILSSSFALITLSMLLITSCIKKDFDAPPDNSSYDPGLTVNATIWQIKQMYDVNVGPVMIDQDLVISGIVVADDRSGSFYKQIIVQDSSSGITVLIGKSSGLYSDYPIGRKIYIKCKGLYVGAYGGFIQLGGMPIAPSTDLTDIPSSSMNKYIVKASYPHTVVPMKVTLNEIYFTKASQTALQRKWLGTLIQVDSAEFVQGEVGMEYASDPNLSSGTDRNLEDCFGGTIILRNSGYSKFRQAKIPAGKGTIVAIYSTYESSTKKIPQLILRDTTDLAFTAPRCGGVVILPATPISIDSLRKMYVGSTTTAGIKLGNVKIHGVVTSSVLDSNISSSNMYVQDESNKGIVIYFGASHGMKLGDSVEVDLTGDSLIVYRETLEIKAKTNQVTKIASEKSVNPIVVTLATLNADLSNATYNQRQYEGVLVKIMGATITGSPATYSGPLTVDRSKTVTDATGTITMYTLSKPPYLTTALPAGSVNITAIATKYLSTNQIQIRNLNDVQ